MDTWGLGPVVGRGCSGGGVGEQEVGRRGQEGGRGGEGGTGSTTAPHKAPLQRQRAGRDSQGRLASQPLHQMIFLAINHNWPPQTHIYIERGNKD